jgi:hypothetical protein
MDEVDEKYRDLYEEREGAAYLKRDAVEGVRTQADVDRVTNALKKERERASAAEAKVKALDFGEKTPEEVQAMIDQFDELRERAEAGGKAPDEAAIQKRIDAAVERKAKPLQRELDRHKAEAETHRKAAEELGATIKRSALHQEVAKAATALKMRPEALEDAAMIAERIFQFGEDGKPLTQDGLDPSSWLQTMKEKRAMWWPESTGAGLTGSSGGNSGAGSPFDKKALNVTRMAQLMAKDPAKADSLARAAGHRDAASAVQMAASQA